MSSIYPFTCGYLRAHPREYESSKKNIVIVSIFYTLAFLFLPPSLPSFSSLSFLPFFLLTSSLRVEWRETRAICISWRNVTFIACRPSSYTPVLWIKAIATNFLLFLSGKPFDTLKQQNVFTAFSCYCDFGDTPVNVSVTNSIHC